MPNHAPDVSVIIPTYNYGGFIARAVDSVLSQSYRSLELLVVDDGSTDSTREILLAYSDKRVQYLRHEHNRGKSNTRNTGILASRGQFLAFLDSDDWWMPEKITRQIECFHEGTSHLGVVYTSAKVLNESSNTICGRLMPTSRGDVLRNLLEANKLGGGSSSVMIRRQCFDDVGCFDESLTHCEDWDMWIRIAAKNYAFDYTPEDLVILTKHHKNSSADLRGMILGREALLDKHRSLYRQYPLVHSTQHYVVGLQCFKEGMMTAGRKHFLDAFRYSEKTALSIKFRSVLQLIASITGHRGYGAIKRISNRVQELKFSKASKEYR